MRTVSWLGAAVALGASLAAHADPLDLYIGAGAGRSTVQSSQLLPVQVDEHPTGWKIFAGWRPISIFGAEIEYVDLGTKNNTFFNTSTGAVDNQHASASGVAAFAVGYLPQPVPFLDFYGKVGIASLHTSLSNAVTPGGVFTQDTSNARFAYGAGVQVKYGAPALRLEYQGFSTSGGDQSLLSLDLAWNF